MSWKGTLLIVLLALLATFFYLSSGRSRTRSAFDPLLELAPNLADKILIQEGGGTTLILKNGGIWHLKGSLEDRADPHLVSSLLNAAASITPLDILKPRDLKGSVSLSSLDLKKPKRSLTIQAGATHTLWLGIEGAAKGEIYAKLDLGKVVYLIPSMVVPIAFRPAQEFRDPRLTACDSRHLEEATFSMSDNLRQLLIKKDVHGWNLVNPVGAKGDDDSITTWLDTLLSARIQQWMPADTDPSTCGMDSPTATFTAREEDSSNPLIITIGSQVPTSPGSYYVRCSDRPGICTINGLNTFLAVTAQSLRSHKLPPVDYDEVDRIAIDEAPGGTPSILLCRKPGIEDWEIASPPKSAHTTVSGESVRKWFDGVQQLTAAGFEPANPERISLRGLDHPIRIRLIAHLSENTADETAGDIVLADYALGTSDGNTFAMHVGNSPEIMIYPQKEWDSLKDTPASWIAPPKAIPAITPHPSTSATHP